MYVLSGLVAFSQTKDISKQLGGHQSLNRLRQTSLSFSSFTVAPLFAGTHNQEEKGGRVNVESQHEGQPEPDLGICASFLHLQRPYELNPLCSLVH
jgi:hypothetical protein